MQHGPMDKQKFVSFVLLKKALISPSMLTLLKWMDQDRLNIDGFDKQPGYVPLQIQ